MNLSTIEKALIIGGTTGLIFLLQFWLAHAGEPQALWLMRDVLGIV